MSYCVALKLSRGLVFMSDTLTNGVLITFLSTLRHFLGGFGERQILLSAAEI